MGIKHCVLGDPKISKTAFPLRKTFILENNIKHLLSTSFISGSGLLYFIKCLQHPSAYISSITKRKQFGKSKKMIVAIL